MEMVEMLEMVGMLRTVTLPGKAGGLETVWTFRNRWMPGVVGMRGGQYARIRKHPRKLGRRVGGVFLSLISDIRGLTPLQFASLLSVGSYMQTDYGVGTKHET